MINKGGRLLYICLLIAGAIVALTGVILNPAFVSERFTPDSILSRKMVVIVYALEVIIVAIGLGVCIYSLLKINENPLSGKIEEKVKAYIILPWNRYWFAPTSLRRLAIFRILIFGFLVFLSLFVWVPDYIEGLKNVAPGFFKPLLMVRVLHLSPPSNPLVIDFIHSLLTLLAIGAMIGFKTRFTSLGSAIVFVYIVGMWWSFEGVHRSVSPAFIFAMFALSMSPSGKALSVDDLLTRMRASDKRGEFQRGSAGGLKDGYALWPLRLTQVFTAFVYFNAGYWKLKWGGFSWIDGASIQYYLIDHDLRGHSTTNLGLFISHYPTLCSALSVFTLIFELGFPLVLLFPRLAWVWLPMGVLFHLGTGITMATWFFPLWFCYVAFINFEAVVPWVRDKLVSITSPHRAL